MKFLTRLLVLSTCAFVLTACNDADSGSNSSALPDSGGDDNPSGNDPLFAQEFAAVDLHTRATPALPDGEFELLTLSTFPDTVSGGDVLVALRGVPE